MINIKLYRDILDSLSLIESTVFDNEDSFLDKFAPNADILMGLCGIYFNQETVKYYYILGCGQHIVDSIKIGEFMEWLETLNIEYDKSKN